HQRRIILTKEPGSCYSPTEPLTFQPPDWPAAPCRNRDLMVPYHRHHRSSRGEAGWLDPGLELEHGTCQALSDSA
ncbi:MAG: hypothetical protein V3U27_20730, partial [Candidatus Tectomicrobia bacterium]